MFFFLSKILDYLLLPLLWVLALLIVAIFTRSVRKKKVALIGAVSMLFFFGNGFIINEAIYLWQVNPVPISSLENYETAIVLSGVVKYEEEDSPDRVNFMMGADRVLHAVQLYKAGKVKRILISGGSGTLVGNTSSEAYKLKKVMLFCGVEEADILLEPTSKNTYESSLYSKQLLDSLNNKGKILLITSAIHMRRAKACFDKVGFQTDPFTVEYTNHGEFDIDHMIPSEYAIFGWSRLIREMVGFTVYKIMRYA